MSNHNFCYFFGFCVPFLCVYVHLCDLSYFDIVQTRTAKNILLKNSTASTEMFLLSHLSFIYMVFEVTSVCILVSQGGPSKVPWTGWLKKQKFIPSQFWRLEARIRMLAERVLAGAPREAVPGVHPRLQDWPENPGIPWLTHASLWFLPLSPRAFSFSSVAISVFLLFLWGYEPDWVQVHPDSAWPHLKLITSVKILFPDKIIFTGVHEG